MKRFFVIVALLSAAALCLAGAQEEETAPDTGEEYLPTYTLGDQILSINLGMVIPLFYTGNGYEDANLTLGGTGYLRWSSFLSNNLSVGGEFGGMFAFTPNMNTLFMIPLMARTTYYIRSYPFEIPISLAMGVNFCRFEENFKADPIVMPGAGFYWNYNSEWAFGFDARYWWVPQIYRGPEPSSSDTRYGNFVSTTLSVLYHF